LSFVYDDRAPSSPPGRDARRCLRTRSMGTVYPVALSWRP
jgi:hypothetical protein